MKYGGWTKSKSGMWAPGLKTQEKSFCFRFYFIQIIRWIDDTHLHIESGLPAFNINLIKQTIAPS